jgi:hypothetical protein
MSKCTTCKCAWIRSVESGKPCPFGLPITEGCEFAGNSVTRMCALNDVPEEKQEKVKLANKRIYIYYKENKRCLFAENIIKKSNTVNCDYGDTGQGVHSTAISGSPLYATQVTGFSVGGLHAYPLGMYGDYYTMRNIPFGMFSLISSEDIDYIIRKIANGD